jgi:hypothetical protein
MHLLWLPTTGHRLVSRPSERCFSGGHLICHHTRGSLSSEKLNCSHVSQELVKNRIHFQPIEIC